jgi:hypothetical protein
MHKPTVQLTPTPQVKQIPKPKLINPPTPSINNSQNSTPAPCTVLTGRRTNTDRSIVLADLAKEIWPSAPPPLHPRNLRALQSVTHAAKRSLRCVRRHLGLYKALVTAHIDAINKFSDRSSDAPQDPPPKVKAEEIPPPIHGLAAIATAHAFFLRRWIHGINVMIYKKPGYIELDRLRVIHLLKADFNLFIGVLFGCRDMHHSVSQDLLHHGQYGKPGRECQDAALSKILHNLLAFFTKTPLGQFERTI